MSTANVHLPADFDPTRQNITIYTPDGTPVVATLPMINLFNRQNNEICVVYGCQLGASLIMFLVVLLTTRVSKRKSPIFVLNVLSLIISCLRSLLQILYYIGPWTEIYRYLSFDYSTVPASAYANSVAATLLTLFLLITIEASLVLQTNVVCKSMSSHIRWPVTALSMVVSLLAISFRFGLTIRNIEGILGATVKSDSLMFSGASLISETASIWFFCTIFVIKLGWTLYQRKKMGLKQWGPMQIITIMAGCTMLIPSLFTVLEFFPEETFYEAGTLAICLVAILLPLSSVWAAAAIDGDEPVRPHGSTPKFASFNMGSDYKSSSAHLPRSIRKASVPAEHLSRTSEEELGDDGTLNRGGAYGMDRMSGSISPRGVRIERTYEVHTAGRGGSIEREDIF
ncbi:hypothetical protein VC83_03123 [Pseudogymnoascus destructans]|uniref:Pheromone alpha factor receptor n=2 Tax=Pseudogymnoascus destructans TaxID=655981 RepID=L8G637_PSED2|nr:uncharacterized protein VC83_03123 [Pseudogymnoascus destructans]ELR07441.1 hypothetical protein GMDG_08410 [Pseudogymnoascus destructans 20631-21]OAF60205.1 hypothetical protein VC83_03123 [Pseudogymnoascus destructans]